MKKVYLCGILTVIGVILTVLLRVFMDRADVSYTEVEVQVVSAGTVNTTVKVGHARTKMTEYEIIVNYEGENYELQNAHDAYSYPEGSTVTAYLSNGELYANIEGVQTSTPVATAYFVGLFGSFILFFVTLYLWKQERNKK